MNVDRQLLEQYLEQMQNLEFELLKELDRICSIHNIHYFLHGGTLLGAVRHKDFIPWDDDVDVVMPREEFEKFRDIFSNTAQEEYILDLPEKHQHYSDFIPHMIDTENRIEINNRSVYPNIDIFIADYASESFKKQLFQLKLIIGFAIGHRKNRDCSKFLTLPEKIGGILLPAIGTLIPLTLLTAQYAKIQQKAKSGEFIFLSNDQPKPKIWGNLYPKEMYYKYGTKVSMRSHPFSAPFDPDYCLKIMYGDYMKFPPEDKRIPEHIYKETMDV